ncbi:MAG TPA: hypothetical protein VI454_16795 [Verrucomicrobiae bacterium]|jgi:hypothetical protein
MKTPDLSETPIVRKYGARGARRFAKVWFPALYAMLIASSAGIWIFGLELTGGWQRPALGLLIATLVVTAASGLTRMRLEFFAGIEQLEAKPKAP